MMDTKILLTKAVEERLYCHGNQKEWICFLTAISYLQTTLSPALSKSRTLGQFLTLQWQLSSSEC